jgi:hypothetical protein
MAAFHTSQCWEKNTQAYWHFRTGQTRCPCLPQRDALAKDTRYIIVLNTDVELTLWGDSHSCTVALSSITPFTGTSITRDGIRYCCQDSHLQSAWKNRGILYLQTPRIYTKAKTGIIQAIQLLQTTSFCNITSPLQLNACLYSLFGKITPVIGLWKFRPSTVPCLFFSLKACHKQDWPHGLHLSVRSIELSAQTWNWSLTRLAEEELCP